VTVTCYWLEPADLAETGLRRYRSSSAEPESPCPREDGKWGYHGALSVLSVVPVTWSAQRPADRSHWFRDDSGGRFGVPDFAYPGHDDPRWPARCECGYEFTADDSWQEWSDRLYRRADNGGLVRLRDAPDGAMWDAGWYPWKGPDGRCLVVKCPGGSDWVIDGRASNCTMPDDNEHRCWIRHGEPPAITVNKSGGYTCAAGGGSIMAGDYHGFLADGAFTLWTPAGDGRDLMRRARP
jgi:hypothetical protein